MRKVFALILWCFQGCPLFFGGGGGGSPPSPPDTPMPVRDDPQQGTEDAVKAAARRKGLSKTILSEAAGQNSTLGSQTILGQAQQQMYGTP